MSNSRSLRETALLWVVIAAFLGCFLFWQGTRKSSTKTASAHATVRVNDPADKVTVISGGIGNEDGRQELQNKVNAWLKENHDRVTVKGISPMSGDNRFAMVMIWYAPKTD